MALISQHFHIKGRVQNVGFRHFARVKAEELHISGWVRNRPDGSVELEVTGEEDTLKRYADWLKIGPPRSVVTDIIITNFAVPSQQNGFHLKF
jgi:acylphosphatase